MTRTALFVGLASLSGMLAGCGGSAPPPPAAPAPSKPLAVATTAATTSVGGPTQAPLPATIPNVSTSAPPPGQPAALVATPAIPQGDGISYEAKGRRDPFMPLDVTGSPRGLEVATTKLTGIVRGARTTLALVEAQDGIGYILKPGDTLGDGRLVEIGADAVVFAVVTRPGAQPNRVVLRLAAN